MKIVIDNYGTLLIQRGSKLKKQLCPCQRRDACGDWCPHFYINADDPNEIAVDLCRTTYILTKEDGDIFVDERE